MNEWGKKQNPENFIIPDKSTNKTLAQKSEVTRHTEKGMASKEITEWFGVSKNTISTLIKD